VRGRCPPPHICIVWNLVLSIVQDFQSTTDYITHDKSCYFELCIIYHKVIATYLNKKNKSSEVFPKMMPNEINYNMKVVGLFQSFHLPI
jgi:hypothetical protein